jgi:hypothetical protein
MPRDVEEIGGSQASATHGVGPWSPSSSPHRGAVPTRRPDSPDSPVPPLICTDVEPRLCAIWPVSTPGGRVGTSSCDRFRQRATGARIENCCFPASAACEPSWTSRRASVRPGLASYLQGELLPSTILLRDCTLGQVGRMVFGCFEFWVLEGGNPTSVVAATWTRSRPEAFAA